MRALILKDKKITDEQIERLQNDFTELIEKHTDITPHFYVEERDFAYYPVYEDEDGDMRPTNKWLQDTIAPVFQKYKQDIDHVFIEIHQDNWQSGRIWGTAFGNMYGGYQVLYCRFDRTNPANSLGTMYHEFMHVPDVFIKTYTGVDIESLLGIDDWDKEITHGAHPDAQYIRHKENTEWLEKIAELLKKSYAKRRELYFNTVKRPYMEQIISLAEKTVVLYRQYLSQKNGVRKS